MNPLLSHAELLEFRDCWIHQPSCTFAASIEDLMAWDEQLHEAIQTGKVDARASWQIAEDEAAEQLAALVAEKLGPLLIAQSISPREPANDTNSRETPGITVPGLVRASDVSMSSREWRTAIKRGDLRASKIGREYVATRGDFDAYMRAKRVQRPSPPPPRRDRDPAAAVVDRALASGQLRSVLDRRKR